MNRFAVLIIFGMAFVLVVYCFFRGYYEFPFVGSKRLGVKSALSNWCSDADEEINGISSNGGYLQGKITRINYKKNVIVIEFVDNHDIRYSFMIVPKELGDQLARDYYKFGRHYLILKYPYLRFCGSMIKFSTEIVDKSTRVKNTYENIRKFADNYVNNDKTVLVHIVPGREGILFDDSGVLMIHKIIFFDEIK